MQRFKLLNLALACALLLNLPAVRVQAQQAGAAATATATSGALPAASLEASKLITAARLSEHLHIVASDAMEGRDTPSKGLDETAKYIATHLARFGLKPAGDDGTFFQRITLIRRKVDAAKTTAALNDRTFKFGDDFLVSPATGKASGALVFVGHGWVVKSKNIDAYKGVDVRDKIVVVTASGLPPGVTRGDIKGKAGEDWEDPMTYAQRNGAKGFILIPRTRGDMERWWRSVRAGAERGSVEMERFANPEGGQQPLPGIYASTAMLDALFEGEAVSGADIFKATQAGETRPAFALSPKKLMTFDVAATTDKQMTQNVVGLLEGKDAKLKSEYVAVGAHYDHVGIGLPDASGDALYNGADDDGSGTVAILTMAEALARGKARPARSVLFVWHAGEEKGLWGSQYFTKFPTVPIQRIVAQLNIDMIGRSKKEGDTKPANAALSGPNEIYVIGSKMMSSDLGALSERVNSAYLNLSFNYKYDDPADPNRFFFRSDHFNYAQRGIPIIFYFDGVHEDYHRPSDSPDKIDYQKMERVTRTVFITALELANAPARPRVDKQLPPELTGQ